MKSRVVLPSTAVATGLFGLQKNTMPPPFDATSSALMSILSSGGGVSFTVRTG